MDGSQFDRFTRTLISRRTALGGLLAGLTFLPLEAAARKKGKHRKGKDKQRAKTQEEPCWRAGACLLKKGANASRCDLANYSPSTTLDCTGCNISRANLRGANLSGANLTRANLSGSCLIDTNLTGAIIANNTNLYYATFCRTTMPDGSVNNSGCSTGTPCCSTCTPAGGECVTGSECCDGGVCNAGSCCVRQTCQSLGKQCGLWPNGCGLPVDCGTCPAGQACDNGKCGCTPTSCPSGQICQGGTCTPVTSQCLMECPSQDAAGSAFCAALPGPCRVCRFMRDSVSFACTEI